MSEMEQLKQEFQWIKYRIHVLDTIEKKLLLMRSMAERAKTSKLSEIEIQDLNYKINNLAGQVRALDEESKRIDSK
ncbi:hypothetical protein [Clostridium tyrobutyricum]|uniref:hypothetical protein n=1 Tax=Clostridium tyrobutyricum TaxID=1519 RepID=UPI0002F1B220|nr:hypothetical protein [Clostridium tyrobutyricum]